MGVVGFARNGPLDWPMSLAGAVAIAALNRRHRAWEHTAPIAWPPRETYGRLRRLTARVLPGRSYRKLWLGRYLLTWRRPEDTGAHRQDDMARDLASDRTDDEKAWLDADTS